jgi:Ethylbenzene dehydrogenase
MAMLSLDRQAVMVLRVQRIAPAEVPIVDGEASDPIWRKIPATTVVTEQGGNFGGTGETTVSIQAVHDGSWAYFLFVWDDPTRSLKQLPLRKTAQGWQLLHDGYENWDEHAYNEDKFSVLLTGLKTTLAGDTTFHAGATPAAGQPRTLSGRGLHYTPRDGLYADVWQWKATSTNPSAFIDDCHFGPPAQGTKAEFDGTAAYRGGFAPDPGSANYLDNFLPRPPQDYGRAVVPRRLPKDLAAMNAALGRIDLDPNHGDSEASRWYMTEDESVPYSAERDRKIPEGTIIPGVILSGKFAGDRADVRGAARWAAGRWALEVVRRLESKSPYDMPIITGTFMRVAAFDHAQIRHTRHVRPIRLEVE